MSRRSRLKSTLAKLSISLVPNRAKQLLTFLKFLFSDDERAEVFSQGVSSRHQRLPELLANARSVKKNACWETPTIKRVIIEARE